MRIKHSGGEYAVQFVDKLAALAAIQPKDFVITDANVAAAVAQHPIATQNVIVVPPGEGSKSIRIYENVLEQLAGMGANRTSRIVALGGGVVGDLAGFVAATYMRSVELLQIPTSILAMVDSSVGGKVGVDLPQGKNLVGAFYPPKEVLIADEFLATLPERHVRNGMAEVLKYGFIADPELLNNLEIGNRLIQRCVEIKARIVEEDEFERSGLRATLNFGHTVGHAIEKVLKYEQLLHGEAVAIGMAIETRLGVQLGMGSSDLVDQVEDRLKQMGLPTRVPAALDSEALILAMRSDKKASEGGLSFALLEGLGACKLVHHVPESDVKAILNERREN